MRWVLLAAGVVFCLPVPGNVMKGDFTNAAGGAAIGAVGLGGFFAMHRAKVARTAFLAWLHENADSVRRGSATWKGRTIAPATTLRAYETAVSMLLFSSKFSSSFVVDGEPAMGRVKLASTAASLLLGWWGFPFGPIYTVMAVQRNLRGGHTVTVGELLQQMGR